MGQTPMKGVFTPEILQPLAAMLMASPGATQPSPQLTQAVAGTPLASAAGLSGSNTPVVNDASMNAGNALLDGPTAVTKALGQVTQNTANVQQGAREVQGLARKQGEAEKKATDLRVDAQRQEANELAPLYEQWGAKLQSMNEEFAAKQGEIRQRGDQAFTTYLQSSKDYANSHTHDWWSSAPVGAQVLGVISQALAGGIQGLTGNLGSETPLDRIIRTDIERQKFEIQKTGDVADKAYNQLQFLTHQFGSEVLAEQALYTAAYESLKSRVDAQLKASGSGPNTAQWKYGQALKQDADAKIAGYVAKAKAETLQMTSHAVIADSSITMNWAGMWQQGQEEAAKAKNQPAQVGITGVKGSEGLGQQDKSLLATQVAQGKKGVVLADEAANLLEQVDRGNLDLVKAGPQIAQKLAQINISQERQDSIKELSKESQGLINALSGGETTILSYLRGEDFGKDPGARAKLLRGLGQWLRKGIAQDVGKWTVNGQPLRYDGKLDAESLRRETNADAGLKPEE